MQVYKIEPLNQSPRVRLRPKLRLAPPIPRNDIFSPLASEVSRVDSNPDNHSINQAIND